MAASTVMTFRITGIKGYDGDYTLDLAEDGLNNDDLRELKRETGVRAGELEEAMRAGDNDVLVMLTVFAIRLSGKTIQPAVLWKAKAGAIEIIEEDEAEDEESLPPTSEPDEPESSSGTPQRSGEISEQPPSVTADEPPSPVTPLRTGPLRSDTSADSDQEISAG